MKIRDSIFELENLWNLVEPDAIEAARHTSKNTKHTGFDETFNAGFRAIFVRDIIHRTLCETFGCKKFEGTPKQIQDLKRNIDILIVRAFENA